MNKIPTAEEYIKLHYEVEVKNHFLNFNKDGGSESYEEYAKRNPLKTLAEGFIEFTNFHVCAALTQAAEDATAHSDSNGECVSSSVKAFVNKQSILDAYPIINIK